jgi:hypothetical protein
MANDLSRIERATLQKVQERGGTLRIDTSNPSQRGLQWLLSNLAERGYVKVASRTGTVVFYQAQPRPVAVAEREPLPAALLIREYGQ